APLPPPCAWHLSKGGRCGGVSRSEVRGAKATQRQTRMSQAPARMRQLLGTKSSGFSSRRTPMSSTAEPALADQGQEHVALRGLSLKHIHEVNPCRNPAFHIHKKLFCRKGLFEARVERACKTWLVAAPVADEDSA